MKVLLAKPKRNPCWFDYWKKAQPFAVNSRGLLTHRVLTVCTIDFQGKPTHHHVTYWCGNGCNFPLGTDKEVLVADPPKNRLLCASCEAKIEAAGDMPSDELAGRHVHRGVLRVKQVCCLDHKDRN